MKRIKRLLAFLLCFALILPFLPADVLGAGEDALTIENGYIQVSVSAKNGGFLVNTVEGNLLRKSDNNKDLLYHSDAYDTSFVSLRLGSGADARDYVFGGKYPGAGAVTVSKPSDGELVAVWTVEKITFTQTITLAGENVSEHGMISVSIAAKNNSGAAVPVQARILLDTCLGDQDYADYQVTTGSLTHTLVNEQFITDEAALRSFYAVDDFANPAITAYMVSTPTKAAIGHWNNLAASLFDFAPDASMDFTNPINTFRTADSACALYYDLGAVAAGGSQSMVCYYGVYSNHNVKRANSVAVNTTAPLRLMLNDARTAYVRESDVGVADFAVVVTAENFKSDTSGDLKDLILAVQSTDGLCSLSDSGAVMGGFDFDTVQPLTIPYAGITEGETVTKTLYFRAKSVSSASYERITIGMYQSDVTSENLLGEKNVYILLPGGDGSIPKVSFNSMSPDTIFNADTRHLYVTVTNALLLSDSLDAGNCVFKAYSDDGKKSWEIPSDNISVNISTGVADIALTDEQKLAVGNWQLQLEWTDEAVASGIVTDAYQKQTADKLKFAVSDNPKYRNDTYGVLAVVKYGKGTPQFPYYYRLLNFADEARFKEFSEEKNHDWAEIPLVFRGAFTMDRRYVEKSEGKVIGGYYYSAVSKKVLDPKTREEKVDNPITINNCLDFEGGTISIYYEDYTDPGKAHSSPILCEFDGELYTSDARTSVWTGKAAFTKLEQGKDYALIHYDKNGNRKQSDATPITLIWPNVFSVAQTLAGMVFKLAYGQLGVMENKDGEIGRVISFAAGLSLGFLTSPAGDKTDYGTASYFGRMQELWKDWRGASIYQYAYHGSRFEKLTDISMNDRDKSSDTQKGVQTSVMIPDILFGCGKGLVGLNFTVDVTVRNMVEYLAKIEAVLSVNTINDWSVGFEGNCEMTDKIKMEAKLKFKSYQNIPIPDELYFYIGGFDPGVNLDGCGVIWVTGGGGGFSGLYDTIFYTGGIPPLKLIMTLSFNIIQLLCGTAKLEVSGSGLSLSASNLKIRDAIEVVKKVSVGFYWYPDLKLTGSIYISMFEKCIEGQGYMILLGKDYSDWFFEMFLRAALKVPSSVPVVGGMVIAGVDLGINTEKIWGALEALKVTVGVTYYWGEDAVDFGSGTKAHPTYPSLLLGGYDGENADFPVAYDEETGRTLYARVGTNFEAPRAAQIISDSDLLLMSSDGVQSNGTRTGHRFNLGTFNPANNASTMVQFTYQASSLEEARALAEGFTISDAPKGGAAFPVVWAQPLPEINDDERVEDYEQRVAAQAEANRNANANVTWNEDTGYATFGFTVTESDQFGRDWYVSTGETAADLVLYNVLPLPKIIAVSAGTLAAGGTGEISWLGSNLDDLDSVSFYLAPSTDTAADAGYPLGSVTENIGSGSASLTVPGSVPAGEYYLRAVYSKEDQLNGIVHSEARIRVENPNTPAAAGVPAAVPAGDLKLSVTVPATADPNTTGYLVTVYNADGSATDVTGMRFDKAVDGDTVFTIGGSYTAPVLKDPDDPESAVIGTQTAGLEGGKSYRVGVIPYRLLEGSTIVYGDEVLTAAVVLPEAVTPTASLTAEGKSLTALKDIGENGEIPVFTVSSLEIAAAFSEAVTGAWSLDDNDLWASQQADEALAVKGVFADAADVTIPLPELTEGSHVLNISGHAADGDRFSYSYPFTVDTLAPRLILSSPLNGSPFNADGTVTVSGISDSGAAICLSIDGNQTVSFTPDTDLDGLFNFEAAIPDYDAAATHTLLIWAEDDNGNATAPTEITVVHPGLGDLAALVIMVNDAVPADGSISTVGGAKDLQLSVLGVTSAGRTFALDRNQVLWASFSAEGSASVDGDGLLNCTPYTYGFVEARVEVSNGACRTASLVLAGEAKAGRVSVSSTVGGTATGGGDYAPGDAVTLVAYPDEGYLFDGWTITGVTVDNLSAETVSFRMPEGGVEAKASFRSEAAETFTVTFDSDDGSAVASQTVESGKTASKPADPARTGYTFGGWTLNGSDFDFSTPITADVTLKAKWSKNDEPLPEKFSVSFDSNGGSAVASQTVESGKTASKPADPARTGYTFGGWTLNGSDFDFSTPITADVTLKAKWSRNSGSGTVIPPEPTPTQPAEETGPIAYADLPEGVDPNRYVPYTLDADGNKTIIPISSVMDGRLAYLAPEDGREVFFLEADVAFSDADGHWAKDNIIWTAAHSLFNGVGDGLFDPNGTMTRAMFVTVLYRMAGSPETSGQSSFIDVPQGIWYEKAVAWAAELGIVQGLGAGKFGPDIDVTREQMCVFAARFLRAFGYEPELGEKTEFADAADISDWAAADVEFCQRAGIVGGRPGGVFDPKASATRAENAAVMKRLVEAIINSLK